MLLEITRVRELYSNIENPTDDHCFSELETAEISNKYKDSLLWMNAHIREL